MEKIFMGLSYYSESEMEIKEKETEVLCNPKLASLRCKLSMHMLP